jgi:hypothetical protein
MEAARLGETGLEFGLELGRDTGRDPFLEVGLDPLSLPLAPMLRGLTARRAAAFSIKAAPVDTLRFGPGLSVS